MTVETTGRGRWYQHTDRSRGRNDTFNVSVETGQPQRRVPPASEETLSEGECSLPAKIILRSVRPLSPSPPE